MALEELARTDALKSDELYGYARRVARERGWRPTWRAPRGGAQEGRRRLLKKSPRSGWTLTRVRRCEQRGWR